MKRRDFCSVIGGSVVASKFEELRAALRDATCIGFPDTGDSVPEAADFAPLRERPPWDPGAALESLSFDWESVLANSEIRFLTYNQLSIYVDSEPGISRLQYFPVREQPTLVGKLDYASLAKGNQFNGIGAKIRFQDAEGMAAKVEETDYQWWPHRIERQWLGKEFAVKEQLAVQGNCVILHLSKIRGANVPITVEGNFQPHRFSSAELNRHLIFEFEDGVSLALYTSGDFTAQITSDGYRATGIVAGPVFVLICAGYRPEYMLQELQGYEENPAAIFEEARKSWQSYFTSRVPRLVSCDTTLVRLYYYLFYVVRSSLYDIPWEPYVYAYTCPWKTGAIWQWSWNTPMNAITERWLNQGSMEKQGIKLIQANCGAANIGSYLHPVQQQQKRWNIFDWYAAVNHEQKKLDTKDYDFIFTQPYTVPNSFLGIWEVYLMTGDREFLRENIPVMANYERTARRRAQVGSLLTPFQMMVDEFDYSLRWKPVQKSFTKGGLQRAFDVPLEMVDFNTFLVELRLILMQAYQEMGQHPKAQFMRQLAKESALEINSRLWNSRLNFYCDVRSDNGQSTGVRAISGFTPLYARIVPPHRKALLLEALDDPQGFSSPYPIPSIELRDPDLDPNLPTYGGDSLITSGVWMIVNALARNGEEARAAQYIHRAIELVTKHGVSSSYSYNPITATPNQPKHTLATQCAILNDLILKYVVGFTPRIDHLFEFNPIALDTSQVSLKCGPFVYKKRYKVSVEWTGKEYIVSVNDAVLRFRKPSHIVAELENVGRLKVRQAI